MAEQAKIQIMEEFTGGRIQIRRSRESGKYNPPTPRKKRPHLQIREEKKSERRGGGREFQSREQKEGGEEEAESQGAKVRPGKELTEGRRRIEAPTLILLNFIFSVVAGRVVKTLNATQH